MAVLIKAELQSRIERGELIRNPRRMGHAIDLQPASYDLTAGRVVWTEQKTDGRPHSTRKELGFENNPQSEQPYIVLYPGQMVSVITREDILMPATLCGTVYSKNNLAMNGIFAFNAGHVDPGFEGPIVIRLINLRATPYTLTLGQPIFTIVFETLELKGNAKLEKRPPLTQEDTLHKVRGFADIALSNALFDLYAENIDHRLNDHRDELLKKIREEMSKEFLKSDDFGHGLWKWVKSKILEILGVIALIVGIVNWDPIKNFLLEIFRRH